MNMASLPHPVSLISTQQPRAHLTDSAPTSFTTVMHPSEVTTTGHRRLIHRRTVEAGDTEGTRPSDRHPTSKSQKPVSVADLVANNLQSIQV